MRIDSLWQQLSPNSFSLLTSKTTLSYLVRLFHAYPCKYQARVKLWSRWQYFLPFVTSWNNPRTVQFTCLKCVSLRDLSVLRVCDHLLVPAPTAVLGKSHSPFHRWGLFQVSQVYAIMQHVALSDCLSTLHISFKVYWCSSMYLWFISFINNIPSSVLCLPIHQIMAFDLFYFLAVPNNVAVNIGPCVFVWRCIMCFHFSWVGIYT